MHSSRVRLGLLGPVLALLFSPSLLLMQIVAANWDCELTGSLQNRRTTRMRGRLRTNGGQACQGWYWRHTMPTVWAAVVFSSGRFSSLWAKSRYIEINCQKSFYSWGLTCWLLASRHQWIGVYYERRWRDWGHFWRQYTPQPQLSSLLNLNEFNSVPFIAAQLT